MKIKDLFKKVKEFNSFNLKDEFFPDYVFNKILFRSMLLILFLFGFLIVADAGFDFSPKFYFNCPEDQGACPNPFIPQDVNYFSTNTEIAVCPEGFPCSQEVFPPGFSFGEKPNPFINYYGYFTFAIVVITILLNHILYNRREIK